MSVILANQSFQYPIGIAENMVVEVGKFTFPVDFVILKMEEDNKVPLILGRPFLHTTDTVIRVKQKQLNLEVDTERMSFLIDSMMKHSYSYDDTCFSIDVIDEILDENFDALLDKGSEILYSIEGTPLEDKIFAEFDEFIAMRIEENVESESDEEEPTFEKITFDTDYKIKISLEEPPTNLELEPLLDHLEYAFLKKPSFFPVIISSQLSEQNNNKLVSILKNHKQAFAWKTTDILVMCLEVDNAKIDVISNLSPPTNVKGIRSFLRHVNFNQCFIKDFSKIARPLTKFLEKHTPFEFNDECYKVFNSLKEKLTCTPVIMSPNWNLPFKLICDANEFAVGAVLRQKDGWILLLQEFDIEIKDKKRTKNDVVDHLFRNEKDETSDDNEVDELTLIKMRQVDDNEVDDNLPGVKLYGNCTSDIPWFADFANYLVGDIIPKGMTYQQKNKFFSDLKYYFWEDPYLFNVCSDVMESLADCFDEKPLAHYELLEVLCLFTLFPPSGGASSLLMVSAHCEGEISSPRKKY
ncbi:reverse transcriptase domain-containing protein [Tanacetum coccineum]